MKLSHPASNMVNQATGEVNAIFGVGNIWGNDSVALSDPFTLGISGAAALTAMKQATMFTAGVNVPNAGTTSESLHQTLMGGTYMQHDSGVGGNRVGGAAPGGNAYGSNVCSSAAICGEG